MIGRSSLFGWAEVERRRRGDFLVSSADIAGLDIMTHLEDFLIDMVSKEGACSCQSHPVTHLSVSTAPR